MIYAILTDALQIAIGFVFLLSAGTKLQDPRGFIQGVIDYQILSPRLARYYGILLIPLEGLVAIAFLFGLFIHFAVWIGLFLLLSFFIAVFREKE